MHGPRAVNMEIQYEISNINSSACNKVIHGSLCHNHHTDFDIAISLSLDCRDQSVNPLSQKPVHGSPLSWNLLLFLQ